MGASSSCKIFEALSTALEWVAVNKLGIDKIVHILDDFLVVGPTQDITNLFLNTFITACKSVGIPISEEKTFKARQKLEFKGIELDSVNSTAKLPKDKINNCIHHINYVKSKSKVTLQELQKLIGHLNFACLVVVPGRTFLRRIINLTIGLQKPFHHRRITNDAKADLQAWEIFLSSFNGRAFFLDEKWITSECLHLYTDAAGSLGFGGLCGKKWFLGSWPQTWKKLNITVLELFPIVVAARIWGSMWQNKRIIFFSDNMAVVHVLNSSTSKEREVMILLRKLVLVTMNYNFQFQARHLPGHVNTLADSLSRMQVAEFKKLAPHMEQHPQILPADILPGSWLQN